MAVLLGALVFAVWQAREKSRQAMVSQQVTQFLVGIFRGADPSVLRGANVTAQDLLDQGTERLHSDAFVEPDVRARLLNTIATTYTNLGLYDRALPIAEEALTLRRAESPRDDREVAESLDEHGSYSSTESRLHASRTDAARSARIAPFDIAARRS